MEEVKANVAKAPCKECPFRRTAVRGWLGEGSLDAAGPYIQHAHGDYDINCHMNLERSCAGLAIYRRNVCKNPREPVAFAAVRAVEPDRETVFANPQEFLDHHNIRAVIARKVEAAE